MRGFTDTQPEPARYRVAHETTYGYGQPVAYSHHALRLEPRTGDGQRRLGSELAITPEPTTARRFTDHFGNTVVLFQILEEHDRFSVRATSEVEVVARERPAAWATPPWERAREIAWSQEGLDGALDFAFDSAYVVASDRARALAADLFPPDRPILEAALALTSRIHADFAYDGGVTDVFTPVDRVIALGRGVCQDFAHLQIACLRALGLPARYVSGYLLTRPPEGQPKLVGADASHAWLSVWVPGSGWIDLDPTNDMIPGEEHVTLAIGRDYGDVSPVGGVLVGGGSHSVSVAVDVTPLEAG